MLKSLSSKVGDVYALEKNANADLETVEEKITYMNEEVDRIVDEQVQLRQKKKLD